MQWFAQAPSNIALIKYMGKKDGEGNIPYNASLSYTLNSLLSSVALEEHSGKIDFWEPLHVPGAMEFSLPLNAQKRFLRHLARMKQYFQYSGAFIVRSSNNFPHSSGLASSASSFAALTKCAALALCDITGRPMLSVQELAALSREGSGSACRSFFSPWALWTEESVKAVQLPYTHLIHQVVVVSHEEKQVPSSMAHQLVRTSPHFLTRKQRAEDNLKLLLLALEAQDWTSCYHICWRDFHDMHQLFTSCDSPFTYMTQNSNDVLDKVKDAWATQGDGPIATMDAGPNIHLLYRPDQADLAQTFKQVHLVGNFDVI